MAEANPSRRAHNFQDLTGKRFGRLTVLAMHGKNASDGRLMWRCVCDCGTSVVANGHSMKRGRAKSCGCFRIEVATQSSLSRRKIRIVSTKSSEYKTWGGIKQRCINANLHSWDNYGGRGITVCERWMESFENFIDDMGLKPGPDFTIERIDNNKGYGPDNCKWATKSDQARNTRRTRFLTAFGETLPISEWVERTGFKRVTIANRIRLGWSIEKALSMPLFPR